MLVFIDEAGDAGRKVDQGSSAYFVVSCVIFEDHEQATTCDQRIDELRKELRYPVSFEFHFAHNSHRVRLAFLEVIKPYKFNYTTVIISKNKTLLMGSELNSKESFYQYAISMVLTKIQHHLDSAIIILDKSGGHGFRNNLAKYLQITHNGGKKMFKQLKQQHSHTNNLLQIADYISGIISRKAQKKRDWEKYYHHISSKELLLQS
jgi:hypothetical protein